MDARELRIENLVLDPDGMVSKILSISTESNSTDGKYYLENDYNGHPEDLRSIPLTEEWLLKLGFEKKSGNEFEKGRFIYRFQQRDLIIEGFEYDYNGIICHPEYVHQLQNLYFALTGEELTQ